jgi:hypothetical protein
LSIIFQIIPSYQALSELVSWVVMQSFRTNCLQLCPHSITTQMTNIDFHCNKNHISHVLCLTWT